MIPTQKPGDIQNHANECANEREYYIVRRVDLSKKHISPNRKKHGQHIN